MRYLRYYYNVQRARLSKSLHLRFNFLMELAGSFCYFLLHLITARFIIEKFHFPNWSVSDYWILIATFELFTYLSFFFFWRGINWTFRDITQGTFDFVLLSPINSRFKAFFKAGSHNNMFSAAASLALLVYIIFHFQLHPSLLSIVLYVLALILSLWFMHCVDVIFLSLNFKFGKIDETAGPIYNFQQAMKFPASQFINSSVLIQIIIFPISLLTTIPAILLLTKNNEYSLLWPFVGIIVFVTVVSEIMWKWGIRNYTSAS